MGWTDERVDVLKKLWLDGLSASQIAKHLGEVTRNAVIGKVHRLGLSGRATPSQPARPAFKATRPPRPLAPPQPFARRAAVDHPALPPVPIALDHCGFADFRDGLAGHPAVLSEHDQREIGSLGIGSFAAAVYLSFAQACGELWEQEQYSPFAPVMGSASVGRRRLRRRPGMHTRSNHRPARAKMKGGGEAGRSARSVMVRPGNVASVPVLVWPVNL